MVARGRCFWLHILHRLDFATHRPYLQTGLMETQIEAIEPIRYLNLQPPVGGHSASTSLLTKRGVVAPRERAG